MQFEEVHHSIGAVMQRSGEVSVNKLDSNQLERMKIAHAS